MYPNFENVTLGYVITMLRVCSILVATMCLQIAKLRKLTEIIDQFLCQGGFYRPFSCIRIGR